jgi:xanthine dehydrogenase small subunit
LATWPPHRAEFQVSFRKDDLAMEPVVFTLNGRVVSVTGVDPHVTLLAYLRELGLCGAKEGCAEGECGACAVALVRSDGHGKARYDVVNSCLVLVPEAAGQEVYTVEAFAQGGELHPVQRAMLEGGSQCGYCTPGFVVSLFAEYYREGRTSFDPEAISGNLCRCTGYRPIVDAGRSLGPPAPDDVFQRRLDDKAPEPSTVAYQENARRFYRPRRLGEVFRLLSAEPQAKLVAGGTDVVVDVNQRHARHEVLVSLEGIAELETFVSAKDHLEIGAGLPLSAVEERLHGEVAILDQLFPLFASRMIRHRATLGGNLVTASPIGDGAPVLLALGADLRLLRQGGERLVALADFFTGYRTSVLQPGELLASIRIPKPLPALARFYKVSKRHLDDISTVAAAFALDRDASGQVTRARLAYGGVAATPVRASEAERILVGRPWTLESVRLAQAQLAGAFTPLSDHRGSAAYRQAMVVSLLEKFYRETSEVASCAS